MKRQRKFGSECYFGEEKGECVLGYIEFEVLEDIKVEILSRYKDRGKPFRYD